MRLFTKNTKFHHTKMNTVILLGIICITIYYCITWYVDSVRVCLCGFFYLVQNRTTHHLRFNDCNVFLFTLYAKRMLPKIIGYLFIKRFNIQIEFGRVSLPFTLRAVKIITNGFSIVCTILVLSLNLVFLRLKG